MLTHFLVHVFFYKMDSEIIWEFQNFPNHFRIHYVKLFSNQAKRNEARGAYFVEPPVTPGSYYF